MGVDIGKDAADAAREAPLGSIDTEELHRFAQELESEGNGTLRGTQVRLNTAEVGPENAMTTNDQNGHLPATPIDAEPTDRQRAAHELAELSALQGRSTGPGRG